MDLVYLKKYTISQWGFNGKIREYNQIANLLETYEIVIGMVY